MRNVINQETMLSRFSLMSTFFSSFNFDFLKHSWMVIVLATILSYWKLLIFICSYFIGLCINLKFEKKGLQQLRIQWYRHWEMCMLCSYIETIHVTCITQLHNYCSTIFIGKVNYTTSSESENYSESVTGNNLTY